MEKITGLSVSQDRVFRVDATFHEGGILAFYPQAKDSLGPAWYVTHGRDGQEKLKTKLPSLATKMWAMHHHKSHAAAAMASTSYVEDTIFLVADGVGDGVSLSCWRHRGQTFMCEESYDERHSLGLFFACCAKRNKMTETQLESADQEGTPPEFFHRSFEFPFFQINPLASVSLTGSFVGHAQELLEESVIDIILWLSCRATRVVASGGVFTNQRLRKRLQQEHPKTVVVSDFAGDASGCIGAVYLAAGLPPNVSGLDHKYFDKYKVAYVSYPEDLYIYS